MSKRKSLKEQITEAVVKELPEYLKHEIDVDKLLMDWWFTGRQEGLRLTDAGDAAFRFAEIEFYKAELGKMNTSWYSFMLELSKKIKCPYYLGVDKVNNKKQSFIRLYDSKIAMMINLYGSIEAYLDSIKIKNTT